jgi:hypothetical protein
VVITGTNGTIYFTTDGSDPRLPGGAISGAAQSYSAPFALNAPATVSARIRNGTNWSGLTKAVFYTPQDLSTLAITEVMFNPPAFGFIPAAELEFLELKNTGVAPLNLSTLTFTNGIDFIFPNGALLMPGQFFVLVRNSGAFEIKYPGVPWHGVFSGQLDNAGETLRLATIFGQTILALGYGDRAPWPLAADGHGFSLVPRNAALNLNSDDGAHWRASTALGGSPGTDDPEPLIAPVLINEALTHTDLPAVDWVELFNPNVVDVSIGGWFLSDDGSLPKKFRIPDGTVISAHGFLVFTEADFNVPPELLTSFSLSSAGDSIYLSSGDANTNLTGCSHGFSFGAAANGVTFGRHVNSAGDEQFPAQLVPTPGATNTGPRVGPVVITEIMYHPVAGGDEFVELQNITASPVALFDANAPTNTWRLNGVGFTFPTNITLASNERLLISATDPAIFRAKYSVPQSVQIFGPFTGNLQDSGELLELQRPDAPGSNGVPYITVDAVRYNDRSPWPLTADGGGTSLQKIVLTDYGNEPTNWAAAAISPGDGLGSGTPPFLTIAPTNQVTVIGGNASFTVAADGDTPLQFRWQLFGTNLPGATNATLALVNVQSIQAGSYRVLVFNQAGSLFSTSVTLTVLTPIYFTIHPTNQNVVPGTNVTLTATAVGNGPVRYQWRFEGTNILNATNASYSFTSANLTNHHGNFSCVAMDDISTATSSNAFIYVLVRPGFVQHLAAQSVLQGGSVTISVIVTGAPPIWYRWLRGGTAFTTTSVPVLTITNIQATATWRVGATNSAAPAGVFSPASGSVTITMIPDGDGDGLGDAWEIAYFGSTNANNAALDSDGDLMSNLDEFRSGTNPTNALSVLKVVFTETNANVLSFVAETNLSYSVQWRTNLITPSWQNLTNVFPSNQVRTITVDSGTAPPGAERYFRVVTPLVP